MSCSLLQGPLIFYRHMCTVPDSRNITLTFSKNKYKYIITGYLTRRKQFYIERAKSLLLHAIIENNTHIINLVYCNTYIHNTIITIYMCVGRGCITGNKAVYI